MSARAVAAQSLWDTLQHQVNGVRVPFRPRHSYCLMITEAGMMSVRRIPLGSTAPTQSLNDDGSWHTIHTESFATQTDDPNWVVDLRQQRKFQWDSAEHEFDRLANASAAEKAHLARMNAMAKSFDPDTLRDMLTAGGATTAVKNVAYSAVKSPALTARDFEEFAKKFLLYPTDLDLRGVSSIKSLHAPAIFAADWHGRPTGRPTYSGAPASDAPASVTPKKPSGELSGKWFDVGDGKLKLPKARRRQPMGRGVGSALRR